MGSNPDTETDYKAHDNIPHAPETKSHTGFLILVLLLLIGLGGAVVWEVAQRKTQAKAVADGTTADSTRVPTVLVSKLHMAPSAATFDLAAQTVPLVETSIYARADGYIVERPVDLGNRVKQGALLVRLDSPDLDQQIAQARATLAQSRAALAQLQAVVRAGAAALKLAQLTSGRTKALAAEGVVAQQEADNSIAAADASEANLRAAEENVRAQESLIAANDANLKRLEEMKKFTRLEAPYDGVITYRNPVASDVGTLISSGSTSATREILRVAQISTLRVFVNVPQNYAIMIQPGQSAQLLLDEYPGRIFPATVQSTAHEMDPSTRTLLVVLRVDNSREELLPGMFTTVRFKLPKTVNMLRLPGDALLSRTEGPMAAVVGEDNKVHMRKLTLGRDYGSEVEVTQGLNPDDRVVINATDAIREGVIVEPKLLSTK
jgi:RND family efflux transporter MFP subunit